MGRQEQIVNERLRKVSELREKGVNPYPQRYDVTHHAQDLQKKHAKLKAGTAAKQTVSIAGRVMTYRDFGKIAFGVLQDSSGTIQITLQKGKTSEDLMQLFKKYVDAGDFVGVAGTIHRTERGELSVLVKKAEILTKSILPLPEKWHGLQEKEERYRKRYLDLIMDSDARKRFATRSTIISSLRALLIDENFLEVETPTLQSVYGGASATPFTTHLNALDIDLFLSISPELYLKRLIVGGYDRVFTICKNFRNEGIDREHNPEFTMMEYYAAYKTYEYHMEFTEKLFTKLKKALKTGETIEYYGQKISLKTPFKRITFQKLMLEQTGIDINKESTFDTLAKAIKSKKLKGVDIAGCKHYGALLDELYKRIVRPNIIQPTFLTHYPVEMIALAKRNEDDKSKINSVQLIINGAEIMKAYDELNDPIDQENRLREQQEHLAAGDDEAMPMDEDFITALKHGMPPTAGYGMGIDRLTMLFTGQDSIRDVILFPFMRPETHSKHSNKKVKGGTK